MISGIMSFHFTEEELSSADVKIEFYDSVREFALMNYLDYMQEGKNELIDLLSDKSQKKIKEMAIRYLNDIRYDSFFHLCIYFLSRVDNEVLDEIAKLCGDTIGNEDIFLSFKNYEENLVKCDKKIFGIKRVIISGVSSKNASYCNIAVPSAFLVRCNLDKNDYLKVWPSDEVMDDIIMTLAKNEYHAYSDLRNAIRLIASNIDFESDQLNVMVQSILVDQYVKLFDKGVTLSSHFDDLVHQLFSSLVEVLE